MSRRLGLIILSVLSTELTLCAAEKASPPVVYRDQQPPGLTPKVFAPGLICLENRREHGLTVAPDGSELFFMAEDGIYQMKYGETRWSLPYKAPFFASFDQPKAVRIAPDGQKMSFLLKGDLYVCAKNGVEWSTPKKLPEQINSEKYECNVVYTLETSVHFTSQRPGTKGQCDLFCTQCNRGQYSSPVNLDCFNTPGSECGLYVAPDESFLIFTGFQRPDGQGSSDMYISFRREGRAWSTPQNMGPELNKQYAESTIGLSPDGKYFFFARGVETPSGLSSDIFWVDAEIIESFRPESRDQ